ncbi:5-carboxymethyl-2-hydroxymuconate isomerase [Pseudomonas aeruginosa]|uniref:5-carboxymethyl-2-hydroxymuconate Delta-isomerase n=1 Tax=Pseudomonas aeruginosa TaxID=287 RepID=UPI0003C36169|nr:5-carboxymethyl-2-hydroxymuconate isomerase [Pseudomonas aeruginosa]ESR68870.1 5-carboxymethyl-2-hydroxymuconate isomerase [Pseudomonas aeruginosa VRFPA05]EJV1369304.1 5-carboxymethyl-2-hydroxymuconate isomerase [Pseudomonas aeruginosa]EJV1383203.1 5-carboxymethyl-2-hydroxymuconate isomerase [Pseudomonas aeruginosa]EJV1606776.1 5-carboxymethyl-2-hydroxymuconate isomerase [Pseudomonas aeruginosa]EKD1565956.1 5-carboxymethyl-2-hydroxymuconate isomerase [Pseudomonas aeruginosa]
MPHLVIEATANLRLETSPGELLEQANAALFASGQFGEADIKSRFVTLEAYRQGTAAVERAYLHACLSILDGRDAATRQALGEVLAGAVAGGGEEGVQVSVEVREMERASYAKRVVARQR